MRIIHQQGARDRASPAQEPDDARPEPGVRAYFKAEAGQRVVLNAGSGPGEGERLHPLFRLGAWRELRIDADSATRPEIVGSIVDMRGIVPDAAVDAVLASHVLEHLHGHEVRLAVAEFRRVLKPDGFLLVSSPDLRAVAAALIEHGPDYVAYVSPAGPITPLDMIYGHAASVSDGNLFMQHRTGFTTASIAGLLQDAGFADVLATSDWRFNVWALALMPATDEAEIGRDFLSVGSDLSGWMRI